MKDQIGIFDPPPDPDGDELRDEGIARAETSAGDWMDDAREAIRTVALSRETMTSDEVWAHLGDSEPPEPRAMGAALKAAERRGWVEATGSFRSSARPERHKAPVRIWRSMLWQGRRTA